jgi:hypothetical protein
MNRLQSELHRLFLPHAAAQGDHSENSNLVDAAGQVRAMVLELARPADWAALSKVWQGVQADLELPAPAIAISGDDAYQLWFSLREPVPAPRAIAFLESLRTHYLSDVAPWRVGAMPAVAAGASEPVRHAKLVPAAQGTNARWSAFVAPDLAPVFAQEPWLDMPPNSEGQSDLLSRLQCIQRADFERALERLARPARVESSSASSAAGGGATSPVATALTPPVAGSDPRRFLLDVMNDVSVDLALRIEAAKALLPYTDACRPA